MEEIQEILKTCMKVLRLLIERIESRVFCLGSIPGLGRSPGEGKGYPLQYSGLENTMDCMVHGVTKSRT